MNLLILATLLASQPTVTNPSPEDRAVVISSLLNELSGEQRVPHHRPAGRRICVTSQLTEMPLAGSRQSGPYDNNFDAPTEKQSLLGQPDTEAEARDRLWWIDPDLSQKQKKEHRAIQNAALVASEKTKDAALSYLVEQAWLGPNQTIDSGDCRETVTLSEPNIALDHAFINFQIQCGGLCGLAGMYVMRRQGSNWNIIAWDIALIS